MAVVNREKLKDPIQPREVVEDVYGLGGDVIVSALPLTDRNRLYRDGKHDRDLMFPLVLASCVLDADNKPIYTQEQWQRYGATKEGYDEAIKLFNVAFRLSGLDDEASKKK